MSRLFVASSCSAAFVGALLFASCGQSVSQSECHQQAIERYGCCPVCDSDCRALLDGECAAVHDSPLVESEAQLDESSSTDDRVHHGPATTIW